MKPIIKWTGGKRREIKEFRKHYPKDFETFVEPFFGGGAVYFDLEHNGPAVIADAHEELINFYKVVKKGHGEDLYNMCINPWHQLEKGRKKNESGDLPEGFRVQDEKTYYYVRDYYQPKNSLQEAFQFYFLRKACYRGMLRYGNKGNFNIPYGRYKSINFEDIRKPEYSDILQNTTIVKGSFEKVFQKHGQDPNAFFFLDPPYDSEFTNYKHEFGQKEHKILAAEFKKAKAKCMLVIGKSELIDELYKGYIKDQYMKEYAFKLREGRVGKEINNIHYVITNY